MKKKSGLISFLILMVWSTLVYAQIEVAATWTNAPGAPEGHVYEMQVSYDEGQTWELLLDNIPSSANGKTSTVLPEIIGKWYQIRVRAWDSPDKTFGGGWSDPSERFLLMQSPGQPQVTVIVK